MAVDEPTAKLGPDDVLPQLGTEAPSGRRRGPTGRLVVRVPVLSPRRDHRAGAQFDEAALQRALVVAHAAIGKAEA